MPRPRVAFDMEVYINFTLCLFTDVETGVTRMFEHPFNIPVLRQIVRESTLITFNGIGYDLPLLLYVINGATPAQVKEASNRIIVDGLKYWHFEREFNVDCSDRNIDHIDLMEVAPLTGSLKLYAGKLHSRSIQDLPIAHDALVTEDQQQILRDYCQNDVQSTIDLYHALKGQIALREEMTMQYGIDLRSKSDAQIAEAVIKAEVEKRTKRKIEKPGPQCGVKFKYIIPSWMADCTLPEFQKTLVLVTQSEFMVSNKGSVVLPEVLTKLRIRIGDGIYRMGIGGLHSSETVRALTAQKTTRLMDFDVASYYPSIILTQGLYPKHIGQEFLHVYQSIVDQRLAAKKAGNKVANESKKVTINGAFGKLGSQWSILYAPDLMIQVTITGQLVLLMLIEMLEAIPGVHVVSANTDGVTVHCAASYESEVLDVTETWELISGFTLERADYAALYSRDVNNYLAVKTNGEVKAKGAYGTGLPLHKNPQHEICSRAVVDYLTLDASIDGTVRACTDIRAFISVRKVQGGATFQGHDLGKVVRWYYAVDTQEHFAYKLNGYKVPQTDGAKPLVVLPQSLPEDLDYEWYINEARGMLAELGVL